ncbi:MAG: hypothetical protein EA391_08095 [Balneolaceae bacterium]|nr:MAG: hypothetical protein EA391_08095 [Balneolaceae bacterium]
MELAYTACLFSCFSRTRCLAACENISDVTVVANFKRLKLWSTMKNVIELLVLILDFRVTSILTKR